MVVASAGWAIVIWTGWACAAETAAASSSAAADARIFIGLPPGGSIAYGRGSVPPIQEAETMADIVREMGAKCRNWGRWGPDDELGTLNYITPEKVAAAARLVRRGVTFSLAIPLDNTGPQINQPRRFNPIHRMILTGPDFTSGAFTRPGGVGFADDMVKMARHIATRGVLLDLPRAKGVEWLEPGYAVTVADLEAALRAQGVAVGTGDALLVRTGQMAMCRARGGWGDYAGGDAPGLSFHTAPWIHARQLAALATDTWGMEVRPNAIPNTYQPLHQVLITNMGLLVGEIFDLDALAADCAREGVWEFQFVAPPLPITGAVGSPLNPLAIK